MTDPHPPQQTTGRSPRLELVLTSVLVLCALVTTGLVARRELAGGSSAGTPAAPVFVENWHAALDQGIRMGPATAPVQLIEFGDFECPFCSSTHAILKAARKKYPQQIALTFVHWPLNGHPHAEPAARASECANSQGRFEAMHDYFYENQQTLGTVPWADVARRVGVSDLPAFQSCLENTESVPRIEAGKKLAVEFQAPGTPTILLNGWKLDQPLTLENIDRVVDATTHGKDPIAELKPKGIWARFRSL